jgi:hypothetical protein
LFYFCFLGRYYNVDVRMRATTDLRWMRGPDCNGTEKRLDDCPGIDIANVSECFVLSHAAVMCYKTEGKLSGYNVVQ